MIATVLALRARLTRTMLLMLVLSLERGREQESQMGQCGANSSRPREAVTPPIKRPSD